MKYFHFTRISTGSIPVQSRHTCTVQYSTYLYSPDSLGPTSLTTRQEVTRSLVWKVARPPKWLGLDQIRANERSVSPFTSTLKLINNLYKKVICHYFHNSGPPLQILNTNKIFFGTDDDVSQQCNNLNLTVKTS